MTTTNQAVAIGVFEVRANAERAIEELHTAGFTGDDIGFVMREATAANAGTDSAVAEGATSGMLAGGLIGAFTALLIPGFGPVIAGGILSGLLLGGAVGGLLGALVSMGVPEDEARYYHNQFELGRAIVTVKAGGRREEALGILRRNGAYDLMTQKATGQSAL
jgi:hypothetical protein